MGATPDGVPRPRTGGVHRTSSIYNCEVPFGLWWHLESHAPAYTNPSPPPCIINHRLLMLWISQGCLGVGGSLSCSLSVWVQMGKGLAMRARVQMGMGLGIGLGIGEGRVEERAPGGSNQRCDICCNMRCNMRCDLRCNMRATCVQHACNIRATCVQHITLRST